MASATSHVATHDNTMHIITTQNILNTKNCMAAITPIITSIKITLMKLPAFSVGATENGR